MDSRSERLAELRRMHGEILAELDGMGPAKLGTPWHADRCRLARDLAERIELLASVVSARDLDRRLNAATDPAEMSRLITARRLVRAGLQFQNAMSEFERDNPIPAAVLIDRYPIVIR